MDRHFKSSKLKGERANKHIGELNAVLRSYVQGNVYRIGEQLDADGRIRKLHIIKTNPLPSELPLIIGDVVHNLHAALDMVVWEIIPQAYRNRDIRFPFYETRNELVGQVTKGKIQTHAPEIAKIIIDAIKPYRGGNDALYGLHILDIMDKHQLLIPFFDTIRLVRASGRSGTDGEFANRDFDIQWLREGEAQNSPPDTQITNYEDAIFTIRFVKDQPFEGESVIPTLHDLSKVVFGAIETFEMALG